MVLWAIAWMWTGYLVVTTVSIDKKSQSIVIQKILPIKRFESVIEIPFSALKEIKITSDTDSDGDKFWNVNLIQKYENKPAFIYFTFSESKAQEVAGKIHKITGKELSHLHLPNRPTILEKICRRIGLKTPGLSLRYSTAPIPTACSTHAISFITRTTLSRSG